MKFLSRTFLLAILCVTAMSMIKQKKTRIVFFGDSITQAGVGKTGYITKMQEMLQQKGTAAQYELMGAGIGGNKVYDLYLRMEDDALAKNPDVVVIWVGVNDVWHKASSGTGTDADKFEKFYTAMIKKFQAKNVQLALCTPSTIGEKTDYSNQQDGDLNNYSNIIRRLAKANNCKLIDLRKDFHDYNVKNNTDNKESGILTTDRVHLNEKGNTFVAERMMEGLGLK
ncbi:MAG: family lipolytic protein [Segetibacter sp.]|jgi:lysophospholipase L1-like esterase|nr:family lipolytic protein [Segetibacter sp.]